MRRHTERVGGTAGASRTVERPVTAGLMRREEGKPVGGVGFRRRVVSQSAFVAANRGSLVCVSRQQVANTR